MYDDIYIKTLHSQGCGVRMRVKLINGLWLTALTKRLLPRLPCQLES